MTVYIRLKHVAVLHAAKIALLVHTINTFLMYMYHLSTWWGYCQKSNTWIPFASVVDLMCWGTDPSSVSVTLCRQKTLQHQALEDIH